jgi:hypothetical protein
MSFITDRDLITLHPSLFREVSYLSQRLFRGIAKVQAGQVVAIGGTFSAAVKPGHVVQLGEIVLEIIAVVNSTTLNVSMPRGDAAAAVIAPADTGNLTATITTFDPQIGVVHAQVLRMLGLEPSQTTLDDLSPGEASVLNPRDLALVEALGVLHLIYTSAAAPLGDGNTLAARAEHFRDRFAHERWRARAIIDTDGDGRADAVRSMSVGVLRRGT